MSGHTLNICYDPISNLIRHKPIANVDINLGYVNNYGTKGYPVCMVTESCKANNCFSTYSMPIFFNEIIFVVIVFLI